MGEYERSAKVYLSKLDDRELEKEYVEGCKELHAEGGQTTSATDSIVEWTTEVGKEFERRGLSIPEYNCGDSCCMYGCDTGKSRQKEAEGLGKALEEDPNGSS